MTRPRRPRGGGRRELALAVAVLGVAMAGATGCGDAPRTGVAPEATVAGTRVVRVDPASDGRFLVGVLIARTGPLAPADSRLLAGIEAMQASGLGADPASPGGPLAIEVVDTASDLRTATEAAGRLLDRGADVLVVGCDPDAARNAAVAAARSGRLVLAPCAAAGAATGAADGTSVDGTADGAAALFTFGPDDAIQGRVLAEQAMAAGLTTAATVAELAPADGTRQCRPFVERYEELGGRLVVELEQPLGVGADVSAANLARVERPTVVVSCVTTGSVPVLVTTLRELGIDSPVLATTAADGAGIVDPTVAYLVPVPLRPPTPAVQALLDRGVPAGSGGAGVLAALALDLLVGAAADAGAVDGAALAAALRGPGTAARADGATFDARQRLVPPMGLVPATG
jgi:ABC-type branched-subunit amino acid transport system substrate-binding protein